jgi:hypothetical protein
VSFASYSCGYQGAQPSGTSPQTTDELYAVSAGGTVSVLKCDPSNSWFTYFQQPEDGMSNADFNTLWPLLAGLMVTAYLVKRLIAAIR